MAEKSKQSNNKKTESKSAEKTATVKGKEKDACQRLIEKANKPVKSCQDNVAAQKKKKASK